MKFASHWTYASWFTVLRIYAGLFWLSHGVSKFLFAGTFMPPGGFMPQMVAKSAASASGPYHDFLVAIVMPNIGLFAELVRFGEVLVGLSLLFGLWTRAGGIVGCFLALNYMAARHEYTSWSTLGSLEAAAFVLSFMAIVVPVGNFFGADALLVRRPKGRVVVPEFVDEPPPQAIPIDPH